MSKMRRHIFALLGLILCIILCTGCENSNQVKKTESDFTGESFTLRGEEAKAFLYQPISVEKVYSYSEEGEIVYEEGKDYTIDYKAGTISRTADSSIPDYATHQVVRNDDGKFEFTKEPRNPDYNVPYIIYVDYVADIDEKIVASERSYLSQELQDKLDAGEDISVCTIGDSIACATDTTSYTYGLDKECSFTDYTVDYIEKTYGSQVDVRMVSRPDELSDYINANEDKLKEIMPDVLFIEFGMNDHVAKGAESEESQEIYRATISNAVEWGKSNGADVILVGFFEQNTDWANEVPEVTLRYNQILQEIADEHGVYFVDVKTAFEQITEYKDLAEDLTGDYMHHPNDFGHQIYFSTIVPLFLPEDTLNTEIDKFVTIP